MTTTQLYTHVFGRGAGGVRSPLDLLPVTPSQAEGMAADAQRPPIGLKRATP